jgi:CubicO group peptidase (beta-lactamase class C family)
VAGDRLAEGIPCGAMSTARRRHTCILLAVSAACCLKAAPVEPDDIAETLRPIVQQAVEQREVPGLAIAVLRDGRTVYREVIGVLDLASPEQVTADTRFHLASVTKTFVATAVLQLAEQGRVDLDAHPGRYLPYFQPDDPRAEKVTIRQVLSQHLKLGESFRARRIGAENKNPCRLNAKHKAN